MIRAILSGIAAGLAALAIATLLLAVMVAIG